MFFGRTSPGPEFVQCTSGDLSPPRNPQLAWSPDWRMYVFFLITIIWWALYQGIRTSPFQLTSKLSSSEFN
ncbi:hypothetical protein BDZ94DRAFT_1248362 [Collybia nuda]|uniref:Uncharacterized protein n=1 Tax=Collybia nuda TaxID=64659 RepID=A0A9P5YFC8_9AGAR|nr:hypothetical protein BDZ94DRAFT_1248362 [Collybia nuda]